MPTRFFLIDGFRYAFFGVSDVSPLLSAGMSTAFALTACTIAYTLLRSGWKLRNS